jgi:oxygen-independent coproporphyrinogen-3 oxidase
LKTSSVGLYIHIPFCHARCGYCDFVTFTGKDDQRGAYVEALCREIEIVGQSNSRSISTIFFGGGTPSVLEPQHIQALFKSLHRHFNIPAQTEITLEANPESVTLEKLESWRSVGINRLSLGLQAYDDQLLQKMGRLHSVQQFEEAYERSRQAGFSNISIDLIYGFPGQTLEGWKETVRSVIRLKPEHVSLYALAVEEHTPFGAQGVQVDADRQAEMYEIARATLPTAGYPQYEISNFAPPGRECRHNLIYWRAQDYIGLGVGAVGCVDGLRWENAKNLSSYYKDITAGRLPRLREERLDAQTRKFERLMLGLRLREGLSWETEEDEKWVAERARLAGKGYLEEISKGTWRIAEPYVPLTNQILLPFVAA